MSEDNPARIYEAELVPAIFEPWARLLIDQALPKPGEHVLDVACGTGIVSRLVAPIVGRSGRVVGLDFDPNMIAMAKSLAPDIEWQLGDLQNLPFADGLFDLVICQQGLQFLADRAAAMRQLYRILRPGGRIALAVWTELAKSPGHATLFAALGELLGVDMTRPPAWSLPGGKELTAFAASADFVDVTTTVKSLQTTFPSAQRFVEIIIEGSSKLTRQMMEQLPADRKHAFASDVASRLRAYETGAGLEIPMESRLLIGRKKA